MTLYHYFLTLWHCTTNIPLYRRHNLFLTSWDCTTNLYLIWSQGVGGPKLKPWSLLWKIRVAPEGRPDHSEFWRNRVHGQPALCGSTRARHPSGCLFCFLVFDNSLHASNKFEDTWYELWFLLSLKKYWAPACLLSRVFYTSISNFLLIDNSLGFIRSSASALHSKSAVFFPSKFSIVPELREKPP